MRLFWFVLALSLTFTKTSFAQDDEILPGFVTEGNGVRVEVTFDEIESTEEALQDADALANEVAQAQREYPQSVFEVGQVDSRIGFGRTLQKKATEFTQNILSKVKQLGGRTDRVGGIDATRYQQKFHNLYLKHSNLTWVMIRVLNSQGFRVATLIYSGMEWYHAIGVSVAVASACTLSSAFYIPINHFSNKVKVYRGFTQPWFPELRQKVRNLGWVQAIDDFHGKVNWGFLEVVFGSIVVFGEEGIRQFLGLPSDLPTVWGFASGTGLAILTQQVWDRAIGLYEDTHKGKLDEHQLKANVRKRGAIGSLMSVFGFTATATSLLPIKITGYITLGTLGVMGYVYEAYLKKQIRSQTSPCHLAVRPESSDSASP